MSVPTSSQPAAGPGGRIRTVPPLDWLVLANAYRARVFERDDDNGALREIVDRIHEASRLPDRQLAGDRPGSARKSAAWTAFEPHTAPSDREQGRFAREIARLLEDAALTRRMPGLVLLASNPFLGTLHAQLGPATKRRLKASIARDLTSFQGLDLERRVTHALAQVPRREGSADARP